MNQIQQWIKNYIHHGQVGFISSRQGWFNVQTSINVIHLVNRMQNKNHDSINWCRKSIWQNATSLYYKNVSKLVIEGNFLNLLKNIYKHWQHQILVRKWSYRNSHSLVVGMQNDTATLKDRLVVFKKMKYSLNHMIQQSCSKIFTQMSWKHVHTKTLT